MKIAAFDTGDTCLGTMYFGTLVAERDALRLLDLYADLGGRFLDTANKYASWVEGFTGGESETVLGRWLKGRSREEYVISTKVGFPYADVAKGLRRDQIVTECERSLRRLGTDYIDLYFAHSQDETTPVEESLEAFDVLIRAGKVRAVGASNYDAWRLWEAVHVADQKALPRYACLQQRYSLLQPVVGADLGTQKVLTPEHLDLCRREGVAMMAYTPLLGGSYESGQLPWQYDSLANRRLLALVRECAAQTGCTPTQLALAWLRTNGIMPIIATGSPEHLEENMTLPAAAFAEEFAQRVKTANSFNTKY